MQYGFSFVPSRSIIFAIRRGEIFKMHTNKKLSTGRSLYYELSVLFIIHSDSCNVFRLTNVQIFTFFLMNYILIYTSVTVIPLFTQLPNYTGPEQ
jgi:hypothetical protein